MHGSAGYSHTVDTDFRRLIILSGRFFMDPTAFLSFATPLYIDAADLNNILNCGKHKLI